MTKMEEDFGFATGNIRLLPQSLDLFSVIRVRKQISIMKYDYKFFADKGISWITWAFDPDWYPRLIDSWDTFKLTEGGEFFQQAMQKSIKPPPVQPFEHKEPGKI